MTNARCALSLGSEAQSLPTISGNRFTYPMCGECTGFTTYPSTTLLLRGSSEWRLHWGHSQWAASLPHQLKGEQQGAEGGHCTEDGPQRPS